MNPLVSAGAEMAWHGFRRFISVVVWGLVLAGIGWAIYAGIIRPTTKPNPSTTQKAEEIVNYNYDYKGPSFGCQSVRVMQYEKKQKASLTDKEAVNK